MPKMRARSGHGSRYAADPAPRQIGACQSDGCPGMLTVAVADGEAVIACSLCGAVWPRLKWLELSALLGAHDGAA